LGVTCSIYLYAKKTKKEFLAVADFVAPLVPLGLGAGRIGNFINGELWGRVTNVYWGMIFPYAGDTPRHPSQLYEFFLEGIILFIVIWHYARKPRPTGSVAALFLMTYACCRIIVEFFREPDSDIGFIIFNLMTMGQFLSIIMFVIGFIIFNSSWKKYAKLS
jgi:phosphatidylglycerol:prolipoprotein diacylglycerol transferase